MALSPNAADAILAREVFEAADLWARHPPVPSSPNKRRVLEIAMKGRSPSGPLTVARFRPIAPPDAVPDRSPALTVSQGVFTYEPLSLAAVEWHLNFADPDLFFAWGGPAFAQDEIQVAEHPVLASLRLELVAAPRGGLVPLTVQDGLPTPVLVSGAERHCAIALDGIYGRAFESAAPPVIDAAVRPLPHPTRSNILAIAAPLPARGRYTREQIADALLTAFTGFAAARHEAGLRDPLARVVIHTGHWGTGAFGGDRVLMAAIQLLAARLAEIHTVAFHAVDTAGRAQVQKAEALLSSKRFAAATTVADLLDALDLEGFRWGTPDGN